MPVYRFATDFTEAQWLSIKTKANTGGLSPDDYMQDMSVNGVKDLRHSLDPANKSLDAGTTSTVVTFNAPSGDTWTAVPSMVQVTGVGATFSGTGLGPYTISNLENGDVVQLHLQFNGTNGDVVRNSCVIHVKQII